LKVTSKKPGYLSDLLFGSFCKFIVLIMPKNYLLYNIFKAD